MAEARVGTAGWSIPLADAASFPAHGSGLQRYAALLDCAEINSSFHRSHRPQTYRRWAESVPDDFRFAAKLAKTVTHGRKLVESEDLLDAFFGEVAGLGTKLGILLVQLPPSLAFEEGTACRFLDAALARSTARIVVEPRHASWFEPEVDAMLRGRGVARAAADPARVPAAALPGGWDGIAYYRLHGSPIPYRSSYEPDAVEAYAGAIRADLEAGREAWCIFDNTASSAAMGNALALRSLLGMR